MMKLDNELNGTSVTRQPICGLYAIHVHTQIPVKTLFDSYKTRFNKANNWKGKTNIKNLSDLMNALGVQHKVCRLSPPIQIKALDSYYSNKPLIIRISGHILSYKDGIIYDQYNAGIKISDYKRASSKITHIIEMES